MEHLCSTTRTYPLLSAAATEKTKMAITDLAKRSFSDSTMEVEVVEVDLPIEVYRFREAASHLAYQERKENVAKRD